MPDSYRPTRVAPAKQHSRTITRWISASEAVKQFGLFYGGEIAVQARIIALLRRGDLRVQARHVWISAEKAAPTAYKAEPNKHLYHRSAFVGPLVKVRKQTWRDSTCWRKDADDWRWRSGRFVVTLEGAPNRRRMFMRGVEFAFDDLRAMLGQGSKEHISRSGKLPDFAKWRVFWHVIVDQANDGRFGDRPFRKTKELRRILLKQTHLDPEDKRVSDEIKHLWIRYKLAERPALDA